MDDAKVRRAAAMLLTGAVTDQDDRYGDGLVALLDDLHMDAETYVEVADRITVLASLARAVVCSLNRLDGTHYDLPMMIDLATEQAIRYVRERDGTR